MRLFIAINFPPEPVAAFVRAQDALRRASPSASFSRRENLHLTLAFLGEQPSARACRTSARPWPRRASGLFP